MAADSSYSSDQPGTGRWWLPLTVVSGVVVVAAVATAFLIGQRSSLAPPPARFSSRLGLAARAALVALGSSEEEFESARAELLGVLDARSGSLPDDTRATLTDNLAIIDTQITEISQELSQDPDNPQLARLLAAAYRQEIELLQRVAALPSVDPPSGDI